jgi:Flp pilus assembly protein TadB
VVRSAGRAGRRRRHESRVRVGRGCGGVRSGPERHPERAEAIGGGFRIQGAGVRSAAMSVLAWVVVAVVLIAVLLLVVVFVRRRRRGGGVIATRDKP